MIYEGHERARSFLFVCLRALRGSVPIIAGTSAPEHGELCRVKSALSVEC